jgi:hypothetical protein
MGQGIGIGRVRQSSRCLGDRVSNGRGMALVQAMPLAGPSPGPTPARAGESPKSSSRKSEKLG